MLEAKSRVTELEAIQVEDRATLSRANEAIARSGEDPYIHCDIVAIVLTTADSGRNRVSCWLPEGTTDGVVRNFVGSSGIRGSP